MPSEFACFLQNLLVIPLYVFLNHHLLLLLHSWVFGMCNKVTSTLSVVSDLVRNSPLKGRFSCKGGRVEQEEAQQGAGTLSPRGKPGRETRGAVASLKAGRSGLQLKT